jgi:hypothetical protein
VYILSSTSQIINNLLYFFYLKTAESRRKCNGRIKNMEKNVADWREGVKYMTIIEEGRKD